MLLGEIVPIKRGGSRAGSAVKVNSDKPCVESGRSGREPDTPGAHPWGGWIPRISRVTAPAWTQTKCWCSVSRSVWQCALCTSKDLRYSEQQGRDFTRLSCCRRQTAGVAILAEFGRHAMEQLDAPNSRPWHVWKLVLAGSGRSTTRHRRRSTARQPSEPLALPNARTVRSFRDCGRSGRGLP